MLLQNAIILFVIALASALFGFGGVAAGAAMIAKALFYIIVVTLIATVLRDFARRR